MQRSIEVNNLSREFRVHKKEEGLKGSVKGLFKREYTNIKAVDSASFSIDQGELVGFIGPNGAGKTTTLKMLSGLLHPSSGYAKVLGYTPHNRNKDFLKQISLIMGQKNQLFWDLPAGETFNLNKEIYEIPDDEYKKIRDELVEMLDVEDIMGQQVRKLSLGQRMRCELIAALLHTPKVLFLDEPTIGLDVVVQKKMRKFIKDYNERYDSTVILTSHYMEDVRQLCKRVIIIDNGQIGYDGSLSSLVRRYTKCKLITLIFLRPVERERAEKYGKVVAYDPLKVTYEVLREDVRDSASIMLKELPVDDVDIAEMPIEEVIRQVFEEVPSPVS